MGAPTPSSQCFSCRHYTGWVESSAKINGAPPSHVCACRAFPKGIPDAITNDNHNHRRPYPGDQGIRWEPKTPGDKHPLEK